MDSKGAVVVVGGGPAGMSAAIELARSGAHVLIVEQRDKLGGAIHRQPASDDVIHVPRARRHVATWRRLEDELASLRERITVATSSIFLGIEGTDRLIYDDRRCGEVVCLKPRALVLALGATERVVPFPGWELPRVLLAGGAQVLLKETGVAPHGRTLIAGSGPLPLALAAQLCAVGQPPVAVLEKGEPFRRPLAALAILGSPHHAIDGFSFAARIAAARVPYFTNSRVLSAEQQREGLKVTVYAKGKTREYSVENLIVHDGLRSDCLTVCNSALPFPVEEAGDGREILGADVAVHDGRRAAAVIAKALRLPAVEFSAGREIKKARRLQHRLGELFASKTQPIPPHTILCRCEGRRLEDLPTGVSALEVKLVGRFGMGMCQGRFCSESVSRELGADGSPGTFRPTVARWPIRPVSAGALARLRHVSPDAQDSWDP